MAAATYGMHDEINRLVQGKLPDRVEDARYLAQSFIQRRLANASIMEAAKEVALKVLLTKLDEELANGLNTISWTKMTELIELLSTGTVNDFKSLLAVGSTGGKTSDPGLFGPMLDPPAAGRAEDSSTVPRTTYKLLDAMDSIARGITARPPTIIDADDAAAAAE